MASRSDVPTKLQIPDLVLRQRSQHRDDHRVVPSALSVSLGSLSTTSRRSHRNFEMAGTGVNLPRATVRPLTSSTTVNEAGDLPLRQTSKAFIKETGGRCDSDAAHRPVECSQHEKARQTVLHASSKGALNVISTRGDKRGPDCGDTTAVEFVRERCDMDKNNLPADTLHITDCQSTADDSSWTDAWEIFPVLWSPMFICAVTFSIFIASSFSFYKKVCGVFWSHAELVSISNGILNISQRDVRFDALIFALCFH